jgi:hypothetical protein
MFSMLLKFFWVVLVIGLIYWMKYEYQQTSMDERNRQKQQRIIKNDFKLKRNLFVFDRIQFYVFS